MAKLDPKAPTMNYFDQNTTAIKNLLSLPEELTNRDDVFRNAICDLVGQVKELSSCVDHLTEKYAAHAKRLLRLRLDMHKLQEAAPSAPNAVEFVRCSYCENAAKYTVNGAIVCPGHIDQASMSMRNVILPLSAATAAPKPDYTAAIMCLRDELALAKGNVVSFNTQNSFKEAIDLLEKANGGK